jgi:tetratricopeptide (TPR) repeat protein
MQELYLKLSGNVPGGFLLLTFILVTINLALYYLYKSSKLFDKSTYKRKSIRFNISLILIYLFLWIYLQPPGLPSRVAFLPWQNGDSVDVDLCEALQLSSINNLNDDYFLHRWEWFYETAEKDSIENAEYRSKLAKSLNLSLIISGNILNENGTRILDLSISDGGDIVNQRFSVSNFRDATSKIHTFLKDELDLFERLQLPEYTSEQINLITKTKIEFINGDYQNALAIADSQGREIDILKARALIQTGRKQQSRKKNTSLKHVEINQNYQKAQALLIPYSKEENDTAELNLSLSRLYMHMGDYETAEICLKRALFQDRYDSRAYFLMSFVHPSRFEDLGYEDRKAILEKAVQIDPGHADAVFELANEYYDTGTGTASGYSTNYAKNLLTDYLKINGNKYQILNLLGKIYLQTKYTLEAKSIFEKLQKIYPDSAEVNYNLGVCYFQLKEYDQAEILFKHAIKINDDLDSYLYLGAICKQRGDDVTALEYFRDRIRKKTGPDDYYAKEAMRQVRIIVGMQAGDSLQVQENENTDSIAF